MTDRTAPELIRAIGEALGGRNWQPELAEILEVNRRTIRRWLNAEDEPRAGVWTELLALMQERQSELTDLIRAVEQRTRSTSK
jgi:hypothetical protein